MFSSATKGNKKNRIIRLERVDQHDQACLVIVMRGMYETVDELKASTAWQQHSHSSGNQEGQNHFLWQANRLGLQQNNTTTAGRSRADMPFLFWHVSLAALADESLTQSTMRQGYDMTLPLVRMWHRRGDAPPDAVDIHRPRRWLLSFKGTVQRTRQPYYDHRWLAAEYWKTAKSSSSASSSSSSANVSSRDNDDDVWINVQCKQADWWRQGKVITHAYDDNDDGNNDEYGKMLWNSTFGFAPGGSGVGSYRFGEILSTGGIPVVVKQQGWVPPFYPEISEWDQCIIVIDERVLIDLPRILRQIPAEDVRRRQAQYWRLLQTVLGDVQDSKSGGWREDMRVTFTRAMEIWALRIAQAIEMKSYYTHHTVDRTAHK